MKLSCCMTWNFYVRRLNKKVCCPTAWKFQVKRHETFLASQYTWKFHVAQYTIFYSVKASRTIIQARPNPSKPVARQPSDEHHSTGMPPFFPALHEWNLLQLQANGSRSGSELSNPSIYYPWKRASAAAQILMLTHFHVPVVQQHWCRVYSRKLHITWSFAAGAQLLLLRWRSISVILQIFRNSTGFCSGIKVHWVCIIV
jgi:hypothetical protein